MLKPLRRTRIIRVTGEVQIHPGRQGNLLEHGPDRATCPEGIEGHDFRPIAH